MQGRSFWPNFFSRIVARLQWNPMAIDLAPDARAWPELEGERRERLITLLAGFRVAEDAVAEEIAPYADAARKAELNSHESLMAWVFYLQRRDEQRHAQFFDRVAGEVLALAGDTPAERREAAREHAPAPLLELFEERLPEMAGELSAGRAGLADGVGLYHMLLEGVVFEAGQHALLDDLAENDLPGAARRGGARRTRRALAYRLRPALPDRGQADAGPPRRPAGASAGRRRGVGRRRHPRDARACGAHVRPPAVGCQARSRAPGRGGATLARLARRPRPGPHLVVTAVSPLPPERDRVCGGGHLGHSSISSPSAAISTPAAVTASRSGERSSSTGFVLLMCTRTTRGRSSRASAPRLSESGT